jgi:hypothetical protein
MPKATVVSIPSLILAVDEELGALDGGFCRIYATAKPATFETAPGGSPLAVITLLTPAFDPAAGVGGTVVEAELNAPVSDASIDVSGTAVWARWSDFASGLIGFDCTVGGTLEGDNSSNCDLLLTSKALVAGGQIQITQFTFRRPI